MSETEGVAGPPSPSNDSPPEGVLCGPLRDGQAIEVAATLKALAEPNRLRLLSFIACQPTGEATVTELTAAVKLTQPTVTHHLQNLFTAGFLFRERRGAFVFYRLNPTRFADLGRLLAPPPSPFAVAVTEPAVVEPTEDPTLVPETAAPVSEAADPLPPAATDSHAASTQPPPIAATAKAPG